MDAVFVRRDTRYFAADYVQHHPMIPNGRSAILVLVSQLATGFQYEPGMVAAEGDLESGANRGL